MIEWDTHFNLSYEGIKSATPSEQFCNIRTYTVRITCIDFRKYATFPQFQGKCQRWSKHMIPSGKLAYEK